MVTRAGDIRGRPHFGGLQDYGTRMHPTILGYNFVTTYPIQTGSAPLQNREFPFSNGAIFVQNGYISRKM